jgi:hypothetical protein
LVALVKVVIPVRKMLLFARVFLGLAYLGTILAIVVLAVTPHIAFVDSYNALIRDTTLPLKAR